MTITSTASSEAQLNIPTLDLPPDVAPPAFQPLSADSLLVYCQVQMNQLDSQISNQMQTQQTTNKRQQAVSDIESDIKGGSCTSGDQHAQTVLSGDGSWPNNDDSKNTISLINDKITAAENDAKAANDSTSYNELESVRATLNTGDSSVSAADITSMANTLDNVSSGLGSGAQMSMINLQSLVSQRQTQLQLVTGMMSSMNDGEKAIASNIGH